jgi:hypothetical protein
MADTPEKMQETIEHLKAKVHVYREERIIFLNVINELQHMLRRLEHDEQDQHPV